MAETARTIVVRTVPRLRAMDSRADLDLGGLRVVQTAPGGDSVEIEVPAEWSDQEISEFVRRHQAMGRLSAVGPEGQPTGWRAARGPIIKPLIIDEPRRVIATLDASEDLLRRTLLPHGITADVQRLGRWGAGVAIGILDTWMDQDHPHFNGKVVWQGGAHDPSQSHGTHVGGTAQLIAPDADKYTRNVLPGGSGSPAEIQRGGIEMMDEMLRRGARRIVVNMSFGAEAVVDAQIGDMVRYIQARGGIVCAAAGNRRGAQIGSPASEADHIVLALEQDGQRLTDFSSGGEWSGIRRRVACIGRDVYSSLPGGQYGVASGTSMASPTAAGVAALRLGAA